jgi:hypothetical protein
LVSTVPPPASNETVRALLNAPVKRSVPPLKLMYCPKPSVVSAASLATESDPPGATMTFGPRKAVPTLPMSAIGTETVPTIVFVVVSST